MPVVITNEGNLPVARDKTAELLLTAHNQADADDHTNDIELIKVTDFKASGLRPGQSRRANLTITLPTGLGPGLFLLIATIDEPDQITELDDTNNRAFTADLILI